MTDPSTTIPSRRTVVPGPRTCLVIVRHGEARCNVDQIVGGMKACTGLTARGVEQAKALSRRLVATKECALPSAMYTSVLPRAVETAEILAPALEVESFERSFDLREQDPGEADGLSWEEFEARYHKSSAPGSDPEQPLAPGGESWVGFVARATRTLEQLVTRHEGGFVFVVAHGGIIDASMISFLGLTDYGTKIRLFPNHTSLTEWRRVGERWRLVRYNDAAHLSELDGTLVTNFVPYWVNAEPKPAGT